MDGELSCEVIARDIKGLQILRPQPAGKSVDVDNATSVIWQAQFQNFTTVLMRLYFLKQMLNGEPWVIITVKIVLAFGQYGHRQGAHIQPSPEEEKF